MELTEFKTKNSYYWLDIYGNPYKKCNKCGKIGGENSMCYSKSESFSFASFCIECRKEKDRLRMLNPLEKEKGKERVIKWYRKNGTISIEDYKKNRVIKSNYINAKKTNIMLCKCEITGKDFFSKRSKSIPIVHPKCNIKGSYKKPNLLAKALLNYGRFHNCNYCFNIIDLINNGIIINIGNDTIRSVGCFCNTNCSKLYSKQSNTERHRRRRARLRTNIVETIRPEQIYIRDKYKCWICGCKVISTYGKDNCYNKDAATLDHVIPLAKGGTHTKENIKTACRQCNAIKSDKIIEGTQVNIFSYASI